MAKSILQQDETVCYLCGWREGERYQAMHWHHIFYGRTNNKNAGLKANSEKYGLMVRICGYACHEYGPNAVHKNKEVDRTLKEEAQRAFEKTYAEEFKDCKFYNGSTLAFKGARAKFRELLGKNYL